MMIGQIIYHFEGYLINKETVQKKQILSVGRAIIFPARDGQNSKFLKIGNFNNFFKNTYVS